MDTATRVQILNETDYISHSTNTFGKGMNPIILPPFMGKTSLTLLPIPLWPVRVAPDWVLSMGQTEQIECKQITDDKL